MFTREVLAAACMQFAATLKVPVGIDAARLLWALSGCESSFGKNCTPRHEPFYHDLAVSGKSPQLVNLTARFGCAAHSSFGPWQLLLVNATPTTLPEDFAQLERCALETTAFVNARILIHERAQTVQQVAMAYNSGRWNWDAVPAGVARYAEQCQGYYANEPMP